MLMSVQSLESDGDRARGRYGVNATCEKVVEEMHEM